jgi:hypothetical protein
MSNKVFIGLFLTQLVYSMYGQVYVLEGEFFGSAECCGFWERFEEASGFIKRNNMLPSGL